MKKTHLQIYVFILVLLLFHDVVFAQSKKYTLSGYVREKGTKELLIGVNVYVPQLQIGTTSNTYGFYSLTLPQGKYAVKFSYVGYQTVIDTIDFSKNIDYSIELSNVITLEAVEIKGERIEKVSETVQMSKVDIPIAQMKAIPAFLGEKDVFKVIQLMPGVQKGNEGSSGLYIRGGGPDQNLIILDDATVYNANHLFGFFSVFNGDAIKSVELFKGGFPARYGGRLSSVINMNMKDGNKERFGFEGGVGLISSRLLVEGPIKKGKSSFIISGRRTYLDILANAAMELYGQNEGNGGYYFYDLNSKVNYEIDKKNRVYVSGYFGRDKFYMKYKPEKDELMQAGLFWQNKTATTRWNHVFNPKVFSNTSVIYSNYLLKIYSKEEMKDQMWNMSYSSGIEDVALKYDVEYQPSPTHYIRTGLIGNYHTFTPSAVVIKERYSPTFQRKVKEIEALESGLYVEDEMKLGSRVLLNLGLRGSGFTLVKGVSYFKTEPRVSAAYRLTEDLSIKSSYTQMNQYIHLLSNTGVGLPTDLWVPSTNKIKPQKSNQIAAGFAKDISKPQLSVTLEGYYKKSDDIVGYKEGASFLLLDDPSQAELMSWEDNITHGKAWAYGMELLLQKKQGKFTGWIGYTLAWVQVQFDEVNFGEKYFAKYDRRHDISVVGIYDLSEEISISGTWVYATGNALTLPLGKYEKVEHLPYIDEHSYPDFSEYPSHLGLYQTTDYGKRNSYRMAPYHRLDLGVQFKKELSWAIRTWEVSVYNAYNRKNPFFYFIDYDVRKQKNVLKQITIFPLIPSISYSLKF